jgi:YHS domain-containing protein
MEAHEDEVQRLRFLIWLLLGGALYWALRELMGSGSPGRRDQKGEGEEMVRDPQCGVYLPLSSALKRRIRGENVYFCSRECEVSYNKRPGI